MKKSCLANTLKGALVLALLFSTSLIASAQNADSEKISKLFAEIKQHATLAEDDAQLLETYTRSNNSWQIHASQLRMVTEHVQDLLADYNKMSTLREEGSPWQQEGIDQLRPVLKAMADHLNATIRHQREYPSRVKMGPYLDYVHGNSEYVTKAAALVHDLVDYEAARSTADSLQKELNLPSRPVSE
jgi:hypothetical protein